MNNNLVQKLKYEIIKLREEKRGTLKENKRLKYVLNNIKDVLELSDESIDINLKFKHEKPLFTKNEIVLYIHPNQNIQRAKILNIYTHDPQDYFYDILLENKKEKQTVEEYLMKI
jgi:hypothetical protein